MPRRRSWTRWPSPEGLAARLARAAGPRDGWARLDRRTVYILPTREGLLLAVALAALLLTGLHYNNNAALGLTFLLAATAVVGILHTYREVAGLALAAEAAGEAFAGGRQRFRLRLRGEGRARRVRLFIAGAAPSELAVPAAGEAAALVAVPAPRRGILPLGRVRVESTRPLGLFRAWGYAEGLSEAVVFPRPAPPGPPPVSGRGEGTETPHRAEADIFAGLASYRPGESPRRIHWPLAARGRGLHVKRFGAVDGGGLHLLDWETAGGDAEARLARLCRWVLEAEAAGVDYTLVLPGARLGPAHGPRQRRRCLEALGRWRP